MSILPLTLAVNISIDKTAHHASVISASGGGVNEIKIVVKGGLRTSGAT